MNGSIITPGASSAPPPRGGGGSADVGRMARGGGFNVFGALINQGSLFLIMMVLAQSTSHADVGRYSLCYALLMILTLLSLGGLRATLTRFTAMGLADRDHGAVRGTIRFGVSTAVALSLLVAAVLTLGSPLIAEILNEPDLRPGLLIVAVSLVALTIEGSALAATQGWRSQRAFTIIGSIIDPGLRLLLTALALWQGMGLMGALGALAISAWVGAILSLIVLGRRVRRLEKASPTYIVQPMLSFAVVSWLSTLATTGLIWADTLMLGYFTPAEEVGIYTVGTRLVTLAIFVLNPINSAFVPHVAHLYHLGDGKGVDRVFGAANRWITRISIPAFIMLFAFPTQLLGLFGPGFEAAAIVTIILAIGQFANAAAGPCGSVLNMTGRVKLSLADNLGALVLNIVLNLILIPQHGIVGAAASWTIVLIAVNTVKYIQVRRIGIQPEGTGIAATLIASTPAAIFAAILSFILDGPLQALLIGGPIVVGAYVAVLLARGMEEEDRELVASILRRLRRSPRDP